MKFIIYITYIKKDFFLFMELFYRCAITNAIKFRMKQDVPLNYKITLLRADIENGPYHVFGSHDKCAK